MRCTYHEPRGTDCLDAAAIHLRWCERIQEGWVFTVDRMLCRPHADVVAGVLEKRGVSVARKPLEVPR